MELERLKRAREAREAAPDAGSTVRKRDLLGNASPTLVPDGATASDAEGPAESGATPESTEDPPAPDLGDDPPTKRRL